MLKVWIKLRVNLLEKKKETGSDLKLMHPNPVCWLPRLFALLLIDPTAMPHLTSSNLFCRWPHFCTLLKKNPLDAHFYPLYLFLLLRFTTTTNFSNNSLLSLQLFSKVINCQRWELMESISWASLPFVVTRAKFTMRRVFSIFTPILPFTPWQLE